MRFATVLASAVFGLLLAAAAIAETETDRASEFVTVRDGKFYLRGAVLLHRHELLVRTAVGFARGDGRPRLGPRARFFGGARHAESPHSGRCRRPRRSALRVTPGLQIAPGKYNRELLTGLDYLLAEMAKRDMKAVLYVNNTWEWSGGYAQYVNWSGQGDIPYPLKTSWPEFMRYAGRFHDSPECIEAYFHHVRFMLGRTNEVTGVKYVDDPTIMAWQIANEPRALSAEHIPAFEKWMKEACALFKSLDANHLLSTGSEGEHGSEGRMDLYERLHADSSSYSYRFTDNLVEGRENIE